MQQGDDTQFDHNRVPDGDVFYNLKFLNTFRCNALYRTLRSAHSHSNTGNGGSGGNSSDNSNDSNSSGRQSDVIARHQFQKLEACVLSGMSERARACFRDIRNIGDPNVSREDEHILSRCFSDPEVQRERQTVLAKSKNFPNLGRYLHLVQELKDPLVENLADVPLKRCERSLHICNHEQTLLDQCLATNMNKDKNMDKNNMNQNMSMDNNQNMDHNNNYPSKCYKESVNMFLCFVSANCYKPLALCKERLASKKKMSPEDKFTFCLDNHASVIKCYSRASDLYQQIKLLEQLPTLLQQASADFDTRTATMQQLLSHFVHLHKTTCSTPVHKFKKCLDQKSQPCYEQEVELNFCLMTGMCAAPLRACLSQGKSYRECTMDPALISCMERLEDPQFASLAKDYKLLTTDNKQ